MSVDFSKQINEDELKDVIYASLSSGGFVIYSKHFKKKMADRGYKSQDVEYILKFGRLIKAEFSESHNNWCYTLKGATVDGDDGAVVTVVISERKILMITALGGV